VILAIDALGAKYGGAATVASAVVRAALGSGDVERVVVYASPRSQRRFEFPEDPRLLVRDCPLAETPLGRLVWHSLGLARAVRADGAHALLCLSGAGSPPSGVPGATFLQQSLPFSQEAAGRMGALDRAQVALIEWRMRRSARANDLTLVQTRAMATCVAQAFGLEASRIRVVGASATLASKGDPGAPELASMWTVPRGKRVLYVGNASPHKNLRVLGPALAELRRRLPGARLFATLPRGHGLAAEAGVSRLEPLSPTALRAAYELADVLVMPSLVETVGLPLLEAASVGLPVVAADRPYAREVCEDAAIYFDPHDPIALADAFMIGLTDAARRSSLHAAGLARTRDLQEGRPYEAIVAGAMGLAHRSRPDVSEPRGGIER